MRLPTAEVVIKYNTTSEALQLIMEISPLNEYNPSTGAVNVPLLKHPPMSLVFVQISPVKL